VHLHVIGTRDSQVTVTVTWLQSSHKTDAEFEYTKPSQFYLHP